MCVDISKALFRNLASEGIVFTDGMLKTLRAAYLQIAQEAIKKYEDDAAINSLQFHRNEERMAVEAFLKGIKLASEGFLEDPLGVPMISNWARVTAAVPDIFDRLIDAVETDYTWAPKGHSSSAGPHRAWGQGTAAKADVQEGLGRA
jgi:glucosyl-3-phosphoglycerate synthase